jgi:methylmalonyl-CoA/ethylmalonyl-CoA epimerase
MTVDHIGIAVSSIEEAATFYAKTLGLKVAHREDTPGHGVRVAFLGAEGEKAMIELLEPAAEDGPIAKFLRSRGPGLHHLAFAAASIEDEMPRIAGLGVSLIDRAPKPGSRRTRVCFLHPKDCGGVLVELVEHPNAHQ